MAWAVCPPWGSPLHPLACATPGWVRRGLPGGVVITAQQSPAGRDHSATKCCHLLRGLRSHLPGVRRGEGAGGPGVQLRGGRGAEKAQTGQAARVGWIWVSSVKGQHGGPTPSTPLNCLCPVAIRPWEGSHCRLSRLFVPTNKHRTIAVPSLSPYPWTHNDLSCSAPTPSPLCLVSSTSHLLPTFQVSWVLYWFDRDRGHIVHRNQGGTVLELC